MIFYLLAPSVPRRMAANGGPMHSFLSHKWYFDEIYEFIFVNGAALLGDLFWKVGDKKIIDGLGPDGVTASPRRARAASRGCRPAISTTTR